MADANNHTSIAIILKIPLVVVPIPDQDIIKRHLIHQPVMIRLVNLGADEAGRLTI
jgi:hypothetical protein